MRSSLDFLLPGAEAVGPEEESQHSSNKTHSANQTPSNNTSSSPKPRLNHNNTSNHRASSTDNVVAPTIGAVAEVTEVAGRTFKPQICLKVKDSLALGVEGVHSALRLVSLFHKGTSGQGMIWETEVKVVISGSG